MSNLKALVKADRLASYVRLRGGFPIPLAGAVYWATIGIGGYYLSLIQWLDLALWGSGLLFPLALLLAKVFRCDFIRDRTSVTDVLLPAFVSMLLFWPMMVAAVATEPQLSPLILAIGMSLHWPVIGWSYGRTGLYTSHAVVRAVVVSLIWVVLPESRFTLLPLSVSAIYLISVAAILVDVHRPRFDALRPEAAAARTRGEE